MTSMCYEGNFDMSDDKWMPDDAQICALRLAFSENKAEEAFAGLFDCSAADISEFVAEMNSGKNESEGTFSAACNKYIENLFLFYFKL